MKKPGATIRSILSENLRYYRSVHGWSQEQLAERSDTGPHYISEIERGTRWPTPEKVEDLAHGLGIRVEALFTPLSAKGSDISLDRDALIEKLIARLKDETVDTLIRVRSEFLTMKQ